MLQSYYKLAKWQNKHAYELFLYFGLSIQRYFCRNFVPLSLYNYVGALVLSLIYHYSVTPHPLCPYHFRHITISNAHHECHGLLEETKAHNH